MPFYDKSINVRMRVSRNESESLTYISKCNQLQAFMRALVNIIALPTNL